MEAVAKGRVELQKGKYNDFSIFLVVGSKEASLRPEPERKVEEDLILAFARLHRRALGVACGTVLAVLIFLVTVVAADKGHGSASALMLLAQFFPRYSLTISGAFVGSAWGFAIGYCLGWGFALLRNLVV